MILQYGIGVFFAVQFVKTMLLTVGAILPAPAKVTFVAAFAFTAAWQFNTVPVSIAADTAAIGAVAVLTHQGYRLVRVLGDLFRQRVMGRGR